jgi:hypothetical protein
MNPLRWISEFVLGCHHKQLSRVFTIQKRSYRVCLECGKEFDQTNTDVLGPIVLPVHVNH